MTRIRYPLFLPRLRAMPKPTRFAPNHRRTNKRLYTVQIARRNRKAEGSVEKEAAEFEVELERSHKVAQRGRPDSQYLCGSPCLMKRRKLIKHLEDNGSVLGQIKQRRLPKCRRNYFVKDAPVVILQYCRSIGDPNNKYNLSWD
jgi:hypothetical protein